MNELEQLLRKTSRHGTLVKDRGYRQVWRFQMSGRGYFLKFYPRRFGRLKRWLRGNSAILEFVRLQALQRAGIPAPKAVAQLAGFRINGELGNAVIIEAIEPSETLDHYVWRFQQEGVEIPDRRRLVGKVIDLLEKLGAAKLGHNDLHLGNLLLSNGEIYLLDGYAVHFGGMKMRDIMLLAHSAAPVASRCDSQRVWERLAGGERMPRFNSVSPRLFRKIVERATAENDYFGRLRADAWSGFFFKHAKFPERWAPASNANIALPDWQRAWPILLGQIESEQFEAIKRSASGDVWRGQVILAGRPIPVVVKRPFKRYWYRYLNEIWRGGRAWRAWRKAWALVARDLPTAWPLLVMQKRRFGYITDAMIVFEDVPGPTLAAVDLTAMQATQRDFLFRRTGAILRRIDDTGIGHFDAKSSNWIVRDDPKLGPDPVLIDVDGIRFYRWRLMGIERLLRSMREHPQYSPDDSLALCQGYAPFSKFRIAKDS